MGRFRIGERIGSGGMGTVYRAFDERLQREVAVKEIATAGAERVLREAQAAARLNHPAIVTLYELGERNGHALLISELVAGRTLDQVAREGAVTDRDVAEIGADLCDALVHAHERGVIHRDIKPQNVIVRPPGTSGRRAKLMDFGIASVAGAATITRTGEVVGTLAYMAPEQALGEDPGPPTDVYALALTLYEAWAGENPVARRTPALTARAIGEPIRSLGGERPDLPQSLTSCVDACLDSEPDARPSLTALCRTLQRAAPALDDELAVPAPADGSPTGAGRSWSRVLGTVGCGVALATLAGPAGYPGAAVVLGLLALPALAFVASAPLALLPLAAVPFAAIGALPAAAALVALLAQRARDRALLGALCFASYFMGALALGAGPRLGVAPRATEGWAESVALAAGDVIAPLASTVALLGAAMFALAVPMLGLALRPHPAIGLVLAMIWAAALAGALGALGNGALAGGAATAVLAAGAAVAVEAYRRSHDGHERPRAPDAGPPLQARGEAALLP